MTDDSVCAKDGSLLAGLEVRAPVRKSNPNRQRAVRSVGDAPRTTVEREISAKADTIPFAIDEVLRAIGGHLSIDPPTRPTAVSEAAKEVQLLCVDTDRAGKHHYRNPEPAELPV